jgi:hypothetical protein
MHRPAGVTVLIVLFFLAAIYLWIIAAVKLVAPGAISLMIAKRFTYGLELAGPYMILLVGGGYALVGWGLIRLQNWARWAAMAVLALGIGFLVPKISAAELGWPVLSYGLQIALRAAVAWYLAQSPDVLGAFANREKSSPPINTDSHENS